MTFYKKKLSELKEIFDGKQEQLDTVIAVRNYINVNYETDLNLNLLAKIRLISKYHLLRLFKRYYGITPRQYLINVRIAKAKSHLKKGLSVTETCFAVGFESLGSFSVLFKSKTGKTPAQFRREQLSRSNVVSDC